MKANAVAAAAAAAGLR
ncbi:hypothetical protein NK360_03325, partial [Salmonella enterica]|nr:hypothetical protein [Salmonella enterica]